MPDTVTNNSTNRAGKLLSLGVALAVAVTALVYTITKQQREISRQKLVSNQITSLLPTGMYNNTPATQGIDLNQVVSDSVTILKAYPVINNDQTQGAILHITTPKGYSGDIELLVALTKTNTVIGVAIVTHTETQGLGDKIENNRSDWPTKSKQCRYQRSYQPATNWAVKKDGGNFDQITGATITPRAVVSAVSDTINWYAANQHLFK